MGKRRYKKHKRMREDYAKIQSAGKKRGLWGSLGATLLGGLAMLATGGVAAPAIAGLMAAGGSFAGGHIGNWLAGKTKGGKLKGTKWYGSLGKDLGSQIKEGINARALKSGFQATMMAAGGTKAISKLFGKGGPTVTPSVEGVSGTNKLAGYTKGLFKGGESPHTYSDSLLGKVGKTLDFKGSVIGENLPRLKKGAVNLAGDISTGFENKTMDWSTLPEGMSPRDYQALVGERQASYVASEAASGLDFSTLSSGPSAYDVVNPTAVGEGAIPSIDQGLIGPSKASIPFDRSRMLRRQATARMQGQASPTGISGSGTGSTRTSAWEGVGESFPVSDPDLVGDIGDIFYQSPSGYDFQKVAKKRRSNILPNRYTNLFGR